MDTTHTIDVPPNVDLKMLYAEFGREAVDFYRNRIRRRMDEGHIYRNPLKTIYLWMTDDRSRHGGYWRAYIPHGGGKKRNHGRS